MLLSVTVNMFHEIFYQSDRSFLVCKNSQSLECLFLQNDCMLVEQAFLRHCAGCIRMHYCLHYNCKEVMCLYHFQTQCTIFLFSTQKDQVSSTSQQKNLCMGEPQKEHEWVIFHAKIKWKENNFGIK